jgi:hypothetical protein
MRSEEAANVSFEKEDEVSHSRMVGLLLLLL